MRIMAARDYTKVVWNGLSMYDDTLDGAGRFQFYEGTAGCAVPRVVPMPECCDVRCRILRSQNRKIVGWVKTGLELTDSIPGSARGQAICVDRHIFPAATRIAEDQDV